MKRERDAEEDREIRQFQQQMIAAHPEDVERIERIFTTENDDLAQPLTYDELEEAKRLDADQITEALRIMQEIGYSVQDF